MALASYPYPSYRQLHDTSLFLVHQVLSDRRRQSRPPQPLVLPPLGVAEWMPWEDIMARLYQLFCRDFPAYQHPRAIIPTYHVQAESKFRRRSFVIDVCLLSAMRSYTFYCYNDFFVLDARFLASLPYLLVIFWYDDLTLVMRITPDRIHVDTAREKNPWFMFHDLMLRVDARNT